MSYAQISTILEHGSVSDFSDAVPTLFEDDYSSVRVQEHSLSLASAVSRTVDLADYTNVQRAALYNSSATYSVLVEWYSQVYTKTNPGGGGYVVVAGAPGTVTDSAAGGTMITKGAEVGGYVLIASAEDAANDGYHPITVVTTDVVTTSDALTANAADTAMTLTFFRKNRQLVPPASTFSIPGSIYYGADLVLTAVGGTAAVEVVIVGS